MFHPAAKLAPKCHGPFPIVRVLSPITYELHLPAQWKLHPVFHVDLLTPYRETEFHGTNYDKPPPDLIDGEEEYEVERIVASRHFGQGHKLQYLVKWKGYPDTENQWVNREDVFAEDAIKEFQNLNSNSGVHIRQVQTDSNSHSPFSKCLLPGLNLVHSPKTCSTSNPVNPNITLNSASFATSPTHTEGNTPASVGLRAVSTITITEPMIIPEAPYAPPEPPFRRYTDTHDSIGGTDPPPGTFPASYADVEAWNAAKNLRTQDSVVAVATDGTPITRDELADVMRRFPTPAGRALASPEPEDPGYHLLHQTTGEVCNDTPLTKAEVDRLRNALPERADGPSPGPLPTRPRHGAAEVVAGGSSAVEGSATRTRPGSTASTQARVIESQRSLATRARRSCSQLSTPSSD
jgi:hypothetical protein